MGHGHMPAACAHAPAATHVHVQLQAHERALPCHATGHATGRAGT